MYLLFLTLCYCSIQLSSSYVLLAANLEDFHSLAKRLVPEHVSDELIPLPKKSALREDTRPDNYGEGDLTYQSEEEVKHKHHKRPPKHRRPVESTSSKFELQLDNLVERVRQSLQKDWSIFLTTKDGQYTRDSDDNVYNMTTEMSSRELVTHDFEYYKNHRPYSFNTPQVRYIQQSRDEAKAKRQEKHRNKSHDKNVEPQDQYASNLQPKIPKYIDPENEVYKQPTRFKKAPSKPSNQGDKDNMLKERDIYENQTPSKQSIKEDMLKERNINDNSRPAKQRIKENMIKERDISENSRPTKQSIKVDVFKERDTYENQIPSKHRIKEHILKERDINDNSRPAKQRIKDNMFKERDISEHSRPTKQSIKDDMFKERDAYENQRPSKQRIKEHMLKERDINDNSRPAKQRIKDNMIKERDISEHSRPTKQSIKDDMFKERDAYENQRPSKQRIKEHMLKERDINDNSRPAKQRIKDNMIKERDISENSRPTKQSINDDMFKEKDTYENQRPSIQRIKEHMLKERDINDNSRPAKQRIKDNMFKERYISEHSRPSKQSIKDDMFKERDIYKTQRPTEPRIKDNIFTERDIYEKPSLSKQSTKPNMLKERDIYENSRPTKQSIKFDMYKERDTYENQRPTKQHIKDNMFKERDIYENQRPTKQGIKNSMLDEKDIYESKQENEKIVTEATEDPADLLKETDIRNIKDSYEDYVTPKKDDSFEAAEPAKSLINIKETINNKRLPQNPYELDRREVTEADKDITHNNYNYKRDPDIDDDRTINYNKKKRNDRLDHQKRTTATTDCSQTACTQYQYDDFQTTSNVRTRFTNNDQPYPIKKLPARELPEKHRNVGKERFVEVHEGSNSEMIAASSSIYLGTQERHILRPSHAAIPETDTQQQIDTQGKQNNKETERQELPNKNNVQEASTEDALHLFKDTDMFKVKDSYEDYVTPKRNDNIYEEIEQTKSDAKRENKNFEALISAVHLPTNYEKSNQFRDAEETNYFNKKMNTADDDTMNYNQKEQNNSLNANINKNVKQDLLRKITFTSESPTESIFDLDKPLADLYKPLVDLDQPTAYADQLIGLRSNDDMFKARAKNDIKLRAERFLLEEKIKEGTYLQ